MNFVSEARVRTEHAARYAMQVGKHWAHNLKVDEVGAARIITFPKDARGADWPGPAIVTLTPEDDILLCRIEASADEQRDGLKSSVQRHVDRFAFREGNLLYEWSDK